MPEEPIIIATRGSALALAQARLIFDQCRLAFPRLPFEIKIIKTTGDKKQSASLAQAGKSLPKGLFTKELEVALVKQKADLAVHSLKDLPTELPGGLTLGAVSKREDVRDVLIYKNNAGFDGPIPELAEGAVVATSSPRRKAQLLAARPDLCVKAIRGNLPTRLEKLADTEAMAGTVLAAAGLNRLDFSITAGSALEGDAVPDGIRAVALDTQLMLPCVGQGAIGIEIRADDGRIEKICERLNHFYSHTAVAAERAFLRGMGGGCSSPVGAAATVDGTQLRLRAVSFLNDTVQRAEQTGDVHEPEALGVAVAAELRG
ncbi:MAG: hydroxymethylbilane synthase [Verrucomicrobia subdivision 3 bacterium]|nr:hydroxymethylbilane synthase [Limisphaerales bacterium]